MDGTNGLDRPLIEALERKNWSLGYAAWFFAGYYWYEYDPMTLERIADHAKVQFGTPDYDYAQKKHDEIFEMIMQSNRMLYWQGARQGLTEGEFAWKKAVFDKDWIIDLVVNDLHEYQKVHIPWLPLAKKLRLVPDWIMNPNIVDSGKIEVTVTATATMEGEVIETIVPPDKLFIVKPLKNQLDQMRTWVYKKLIELSAKGKPCPTRNEMIEIIKEECPLEYSVKSSEQIIKYTKDSEEVEWSFGALKLFIIRHTEKSYLMWP